MFTDPAGGLVPLQAPGKGWSGTAFRGTP